MLFNIYRLLKTSLLYIIVINVSEYLLNAQFYLYELRHNMTERNRKARIQKVEDNT
jgi:hypothetical protein